MRLIDILWLAFISFSMVNAQRSIRRPVSNVNTRVMEDQDTVDSPDDENISNNGNRIPTSTPNRPPVANTFNPHPLATRRLVCSTLARRKEVRDMKADGHLPLFVNAFKKLALDGTLARFVNWHGPIEGGYWDFAHFTPRFLPWHRIFVKEFEKALMAAGAPYLPYWDWTLDSQQPWASPILSDEYFGRPDPSKNYAITDSPFAQGLYTCPVGGGPIIRNYPPDGPTSAFYHASLIHLEGTFSQFAQTLEYGAHAVVHSTLGGPTDGGGQLSSWTSPNDPLFWLHHSFVDKIWAAFQARNRENNFGGFDGVAYRMNMNSSEIMYPWGIPVQNILNIQDICVNFVDPSPNVTQAIKKVDKISTPEIGINWFNNSKADVTVAEKVATKLKDKADNVNTRLHNGEDITRRIRNNEDNAAGHTISHTFALIISMTSCIIHLYLSS